MPVVVPREAYERLRKVMDKPLPKYTSDISSFTTRYLFLRYTIGGKTRVKRIEVREHFSNTEWSWQLDMIIQHRKSKLMKKNLGRQGIVIALDDPSHLEPLLQQTLEHLGADSCETVEYHWGEDIEDNIP